MTTEARVVAGANPECWSHVLDTIHRGYLLIKPLKRMANGLVDPSTLESQVSNHFSRHLDTWRPVIIGELYENHVEFKVTIERGALEEHPNLTLLTGLYNILVHYVTLSDLARGHGIGAIYGPANVELWEGCLLKAKVALQFAEACAQRMATYAEERPCTLGVTEEMQANLDALLKPILDPMSD